MKKYIFLILIPIFIIIFLIYPKDKLTNYNDSILTSKVANSIMNYGLLSDKYEKVSVSNLDVIVLLESGLYTNNYKELEHDASILFSLVKEINNVTFKNGLVNYTFKFNDYNKLYQNIKTIDLDQITNRLENMPNNKVYLGNVGGNYDLFDKSDVCEYNDFIIYENDYFTYNLKCSNVELIEVVRNDYSYKLMEALNSKLFTAEDLLDKNMNIIKTLK